MQSATFTVRSPAGTKLRVIAADIAYSKPHRAIEVFLGDYIDRGPDSRATLDLLIRRARRGNTVFLKGNHEAFLAEVFLDPSASLIGPRLAGCNADTLRPLAVAQSG
jgi:hypothetical protein